MVGGGQCYATDAVEHPQCPCGGEVLVVEVGIPDVGCGESAGDERFHQGGLNTDCYVSADSRFDPLPYGS